MKQEGMWRKRWKGKKETVLRKKKGRRTERKSDERQTQKVTEGYKEVIG
jgi:hypothetical protein